MFLFTSSKWRFKNEKVAVFGVNEGLKQCKKHIKSALLRWGFKNNVCEKVDSTKVLCDQKLENHAKSSSLCHSLGEDLIFWKKANIFLFDFYEGSVLVFHKKRCVFSNYRLVSALKPVHFESTFQTIGSRTLFNSELKFNHIPFANQSRYESRTLCTTSSPQPELKL